MKMIKHLTLILLLLGTAELFGQQDPMYTQYMFNTLSINPAYAGSADMVTLNALYRDQWVNIDGAPVTQTIALHGPLRKESLSLGGSLINDSHGPVNQTGMYVDFSYRIFLENSRLAFGIKAGANLFQANLVNLNTVEDNDPVFAANINNKVLPNFGGGVFWYSKTRYLGFSVPKLIRNKLIDGALPDFENNRERQHYFLIGGMVIDVNNYLKFKPSFLFKAVRGAPPSLDLTANFLFYEKFWIGAMYRWQDAVGALLQYEVNGKIKIGYAYDYSLSDIGNYTSGSHEIMLGIDFFRGVRGDVSPRYF